MSVATALENPTLRPWPRMVTLTLVITGLLLQFGAGWWAIGNDPLGVFAPLALAALAVCFFWPSVGLILLVVSWFFPIPVFGIPGAYPADVLMAGIFAGHVVRQLANGRPVFPPTPITALIGAWLAVYAISMINATDMGQAIKSWLRHVQLFALYFAVLSSADEMTIKRCIRVFLLVCALISVFNIVTFLQWHGGTRAFGPAGVLFSGFLALATTMAAAFYLLERRKFHRLLFAMLVSLFIVAQMANQSRGAMMQLLSGVAFVVIVAYLWDRQHDARLVLPRLRQLALWSGVTVVIVMVGAGPYFFRVLTRYESKSGSELLTLRYREFLWSSAMQIFTLHPLVGVGPAQTVHMTSYLPELRFDPVEAPMRGLSVHNAALQYLAESGLIGAVLLTWLLWRALGFGRRIIGATKDSAQAAWQIGVWGIVFVIVNRYLYEGHLLYSISGMTTTAFIAMLYNFAPRIREN